MKKLFTLFTIISVFAFSTAIKAQLVARYSATHVSGDPNSLAESHAVIINTATSGDSIVVKVYRVNATLAPNHKTYFCWGGQCYSPSSSYSFTSPESVKLAPGDSTDQFVAYALPNGSNGTDVVSYKFYDVANSSNQVTIEYTYDFATGISDLNASGNYLNCYQSNSSDISHISYSLQNFKDAKVVIRNLVGSVVKELKLTDKQGVVDVSTAEMPSGIYMYFLYNNNTPVASKKMVVSH